MNKDHRIMKLTVLWLKQRRLNGDEKRLARGIMFPNLVKGVIWMIKIRMWWISMTEIQ
jgi:hypothetical protein